MKIVATAAVFALALAAGSTFAAAKDNGNNSTRASNTNDTSCAEILADPSFYSPAVVKNCQ